MQVSRFSLRVWLCVLIWARPKRTESGVHDSQATTDLNYTCCMGSTVQVTLPFYFQAKKSKLRHGMSIKYDCSRSDGANCQGVWRTSGLGRWMTVLCTEPKVVKSRIV